MFFKPQYIIYPAHRQCRAVLLPQGPVQAGEGYSLRIEAFSGLRRYSAARQGCAFSQTEFASVTGDKHLRAVDGCLTLDVTFPQEDRWLCSLIYRGEVLEKFEVYSLEDDLFGLTPYKGDNHMHSFISDGKDSPEYMAAASCRRGYDYCVLTDHYNYQASLRAKAIMDALNVDFRVLPGEEIHAPGNHVHIINLGGNASVNDWYRDEPEDYERAVASYVSSMADVPMSEADKRAAASSQAVFDKIHEYGGAAVLCHPHWILRGLLQQSEDITDYLFDNKRFDIYELIAGGAFEEGTQMQISYYQEREKMPVVGSSDTHQQFGGRLEPGNFTVVFAEEMTVESIRESIRAGRCTAGFDNKFYGDYRLLKYTYFLKANYFPEHDLRCVSLGAKMLRYASSGADPEGKYADEARAAESPAALFATLRYKE